MQRFTLSQDLVRVVQALCEDTDTPRSLTVLLLVKNAEYGQLFSLKTDPKHYDSAEAYHADNEVTELLRKLNVSVPGVDRVAAALESFRACESQCYVTNRRFNRLRNGGPFGPTDARLLPFLDDVRKNIREILGPVPVDLELRFGPGATFEDRGRLTTVPDKIQNRPTVTSGASPLLAIWERTAWARARVSDNSSPYYPKVVRGNRFTTVPKDGLKDRGICIEPSINVSLQLAVGGVLRRRLKLFGIDLDEGQSLHRSLARMASLTGRYATMDLSNASDTVSLELVRSLLPQMWLDVLESLRSPYTLVKGKWHKLEKFSSMGNGFTFELETLLFLALAWSTSNLSGYHHQPGDGIWVYGDDIIVPVEISNSVEKCLQWAGFSPNPRKTFHEGRFRESCGGDFFDGQPVRAYYLKELPDEPHKIIAMANGLRGVARNESLSDSRFVRVKRAWWRCLDMLPNHIRRLRGPASAGDLVIHDSQDWQFRKLPSSPDIGQVRCWKPVQRSLGWEHWKPEVIFASALYGVPGDGPIPRNGVTGYRKGWLVIMERPTASIPGSS